MNKNEQDSIKSDNVDDKNEQSEDKKNKDGEEIVIMR